MIVIFDQNGRFGITAGGIYRSMYRYFTDGEEDFDKIEISSFL